MTGSPAVAGGNRIACKLLVLLTDVSCRAANFNVRTIAVVSAIAGILGLPPTSTRTLGVIVLPLPYMIHVSAIILFN